MGLLNQTLTPEELAQLMQAGEMSDLQHTFIHALDTSPEIKQIMRERVKQFLTDRGHTPSPD